MESYIIISVLIIFIAFVLTRMILQPFLGSDHILPVFKWILRAFGLIGLLLVLVSGHAFFAAIVLVPFALIVIAAILYIINSFCCRNYLFNKQGRLQYEIEIKQRKADQLKVKLDGQQGDFHRLNDEIHGLQAQVDASSKRRTTIHQ